MSKPFSRPSDEVPYGGDGAVRAEMGGRRGRTTEAEATTLPRAKGRLSTKRGLWPEDRGPADQNAKPECPKGRICMKGQRREKPHSGAER